MRELLAPHAADLVAKVVQRALDGDTTALRICLDRLIPPVKAKDDPVTLPLAAGSLADKGQAVLTALGEGTLPPDVASAILQAIASHARIIEVNDLEQRIAALEAKQGG
jgi:hypothetical protein